MTRVAIAHLSDPHFGTVLEPVRTALTARLKELAPTLVLLSGDITQRARTKQFREARAFLDALEPLPAFAVPGNHDIPLYNVLGRLLSPYRGFHALVQKKRETRTKIGDVEIFALNSTSRWRHVQGTLDVGRIEPALLSGKSEAAVRIVAVHHPLDCAKVIDEKNLLTNRQDVMELFGRARIDLVLSGHIHDPFVTMSTIRYPEVERSMIVSVAGTCLSWRTRKGAPNSFHFIEVDTSAPLVKMAISRNDLGPEGRFHVVSRAEFSRQVDDKWVSAAKPALPPPARSTPESSQN